MILIYVIKVLMPKTETFSVKEINHLALRRNEGDPRPLLGESTVSKAFRHRMEIRSRGIITLLRDVKGLEASNHAILGFLLLLTYAFRRRS